MIDNTIKKRDCNGCYACQAACAVDCITMQRDKEGFEYPVVDNARCTRCEVCVKTCPVLGRAHRASTVAASEAYGGYCKDTELRRQSSSGGAFSLLATPVLERGGVVFGAAFDADFRVQHTYVEHVEELSRLRGSKYVQSRIGDTFRQAKAFLKEGREVLFCGTPCQIGGLNAYLRKPYPNLLTVDFICHGVPSPKVYETLLAQVSTQSGKKIEGVSFRGKENGWRRFTLRITSQGVRISPEPSNMYIRGFLRNLFLRPSCYRCAFHNFTSGADITIADFWGVKQCHAQLDTDDTGVSLVFTHTAIGSSAFTSITAQMKVEPISVEHGMTTNIASLRSPILHPNRASFFARLNTGEDMSDFIPRLLKSGISYHLLRQRIKSILRKLLHR